MRYPQCFSEKGTPLNSSKWYAPPMENTICIATHTEAVLGGTPAVHLRTCTRRAVITFLVLSTLLPLVTLSSLRAAEMTLSQAQTLLTEEKSDANALFSVSFFFEEAGRPFSALKAIERAIEINGKIPGYHARHSQLLLQRKRIREATAAYARVTELDPKATAFLAAEARALAGCSKLREAAAVWNKILQVVSEPGEKIDATANFTAILNSMGNLAGAETAWHSTWKQLTDWTQRLNAADQIAALMLAQNADDRTLTFWEEWFAVESMWEYRAEIAVRMANIVARNQKTAAARGAHAWEVLLESTHMPAQKQRAAIALAEILLDENKAADALKILQPVKELTDWHGNYNVAKVVARALVALKDSAGQEKLWLDQFKSATTDEQRTLACSYLDGLVKDFEVILNLQRELKTRYPDNIYSLTNCAGQLFKLKKYEEALQATIDVLPVLRKKKNFHAHEEYYYCKQLVDICSMADWTDRVVPLLSKHFQRPGSQVNFHDLFNLLERQNGKVVVRRCVMQLAELGGRWTLGAATYLNSDDPEEAQVFWEKAAADSRLDVAERYNCLQNLLQQTTQNRVRIELARRMCALPVQDWEKRQAYKVLAENLGREGLVEEGVEVVRQTTGGKGHDTGVMEDILEILGNSIFDNNRLGIGLRTQEDMQKALRATMQIYTELSWKKDFRDACNPLLDALFDIQVSRNDLEGAVAFLHQICEINDNPALRLRIATTLEDKGTMETTLTAYQAYAESVCMAHQKSFKASEKRQRELPSVDERCLNFFNKQKKMEGFLTQMEAVLQKSEGTNREARADFVLAVYRSQNQAEQMLRFLERLKESGLSGKFYQTQQLWAKAALEMGNAASRADAQRRDQLLKDVACWKKAFGDNPEDYQAAINVYKTYVLLGQKAEGNPFLEKCLLVAPMDPVVLECHGRELMLEKSYTAAFEEFCKAAELAGSRQDFEASILSACEMAGKNEAALKLAVNSLQCSNHNSRAARTVEQILDLAHRTNGQKILQNDLRQRLKVSPVNTRQDGPTTDPLAQPWPEEFLRLALQVAWDCNDSELALASVDALLTKVCRPGHAWEQRYQWSNLAQQAQNRRKLPEAIRIHQALLTTALRDGQNNNLHEYMTLARLLIESNAATEAADLMFQGLALAAGTNRAHAEPPWNEKGVWDRDLQQRRRKRPAPPEGNALSSRDAQGPWITSIVSLANSELSSGAELFYKACGTRLTGLINEEFKLWLENPETYTGPLTDDSIGAELGRRENVDNRIQAAAAAQTAGAWIRLTFARRLAGVVLNSKPNDQKIISFEEIRTACQTAVAQAGSREKGQIQLQIVQLYRKLLSQPEAVRLAGVTVEEILDAYDAVLQSDSELWRMEALKPAAELAEAEILKSYPVSHGDPLESSPGRKYLVRGTNQEELLKERQRDGLLVNRLLKVLLELQKYYPKSNSIRGRVARTLLANGETKRAVELLNSGLKENSSFSALRYAANLCMANWRYGTDLLSVGVEQSKTGDPALRVTQINPEVPRPQATLTADEACLAAVEFYTRAGDAYQTEVAIELDANGKPVTDNTLCGLKLDLAVALAGCGRLKDALQTLSQMATERPDFSFQRDCMERLAIVFLNVGKLDELQTTLRSQITKHPKSVPLRLAYADVLEKTGLVGDATETLAVAKALQPELSIVKRLIAVLRKSGDLATALDECKLWAASFPSDDQAYKTLAGIYGELKDETGELRALTMRLEIAPREATQCRDVGVLFCQRKDFNRALPLLERAVELRPEEPIRVIDLAEACYLAQDFARAEQLCRDALGKDWSKGLSPELLARMPPWRGTFENRTHALLVDIYTAQRMPDKAAQERMLLPQGYQRPELSSAFEKL